MQSDARQDVDSPSTLSGGVRQDLAAAAAPNTVVDVLNERNWVANLPQLLKYAQSGDRIQVPNESVLALAEQLRMERNFGKDVLFSVEMGEGSASLEV
ncbi:MAG: hypothetical protein AAF889_00170 [Cyanobacteria bacterium P01_D01_bin.73]